MSATRALCSVSRPQARGPFVYVPMLGLWEEHGMHARRPGFEHRPCQQTCSVLLCTLNVGFLFYTREIIISALTTSQDNCQDQIRYASALFA